MSSSFKVIFPDEELEERRVRILTQNEVTGLANSSSYFATLFDLERVGKEEDEVDIIFHKEEFDLNMFEKILELVMIEKEEDKVKYIIDRLKGHEVIQLMSVADFRCMDELFGLLLRRRLVKDFDESLNLKELYMEYARDGKERKRDRDE
jgi:hypothetical protein